MSGIFDRIVPGDDRVSVHLLKAAVYLVTRGAVTAQQMNDKLDASVATPLDAAAKADLAAVRSLISAASGSANKLELLERFDSLNVCVETGLLTNEAAYRSEMGIA